MPSLKGPRGLRLEKVIGITADSNACLDVNPKNDEVAYPAGCIVVIYSFKKNKQRAYMRTAKAVSCLKYDPEGEILAIGEFGLKPSITLWDIANHKRLSELKGHNHGVQCLAFNPTDRRILVTIGVEADGQILIWDWENSVVLAKRSFTGKIFACDFTQDGQLLCTVGEGEYNLRFWEIGNTNKSSYPSDYRVNGGKSGTGSFTLTEREVTLMPDYKTAVFKDVSCGRGDVASMTFAVTSCGALVCFDNTNRMMQKWVLLETDEATSVNVKDTKVVCGCNNGVVRIFDALTLEFITTLPSPPGEDELYSSLLENNQDQASTSRNGDEEKKNGSKGYACTMGVKWCGTKSHVISVYDDRGVFVWDVTNPHQIEKARSFLNHKAALWDLTVWPYEDKNEKSRTSNSEGLFLTCGDDNCIRFWRLGNSKSRKRESSGNIYSKELARIIKINSGAVRSVMRSVSISPHIGHVAVGDKEGYIRVYDVNSKTLIYEKKSHQSDVASVEYSQACIGGKISLLASAGSDMFLHIYSCITTEAWDLTEGPKYEIVQSLQDHCKGINGVRFSADGKRLLSCGDDNRVIIYTVNQSQSTDDKSRPPLKKLKSISVPTGSVNGLDIDVTNKFLATVGRNKQILIWSIATGKLIREYEYEKDENKTVEPLHLLRLDPAGMYLTTCANDKTIRLFDFYSGECVGKGSGHSELVTGIAFSSDCKRLVSVSCDGCMFVWRLASDITNAIKDRLQELKTEKAMRRVDSDENIETIIESNLKFSSGNLPTWARDKSHEGEFAVDFSEKVSGIENLKELNDVIETEENDESHLTNDNGSFIEKAPTHDLTKPKDAEKNGSVPEESGCSIVENAETDTQPIDIGLDLDGDLNDKTENDITNESDDKGNEHVALSKSHLCQESLVNEESDVCNNTVNPTDFLVENKNHEIQENKKHEIQTPTPLIIPEEAPGAPEEVDNVITSPLQLSPLTPMDIPDNEIEISKSSVSTAPRSPLPKVGVPKTLARERDALKLKDTESAVARMRTKLKKIGILASTKKISREHMDEITEEQTSPDLLQKCSKNTIPLDGESCDRFQKGDHKSELIEKENIDENHQIVAYKKEAEKLKISTEELIIETEGLSSVNPSLQTVNDVRQTCEESLRDLRQALQSTISTLANVQNLETTLSSVVEKDNAPGQANDLKQIREVVGSFRNQVKSYMGSDVESAASLLSARTSKRAPYDSVKDISQSQSFFLPPTTPAGQSYFGSSEHSVSSQVDIQLKMMEQLATITSMLEKMNK